MTRTLSAFLGVVVAGLCDPALAADLSQEKLDTLRWEARPVVIFADSPNDPRVADQLQLLEAEAAALEDRDVVILVDTDPSARSYLRQKLRPRDFGFVLIGKDGQVKYRKPDPVPVRELVRLIDRMPMRQQEIEAERRRTN
ncbi:MAG: DUF4174 domain-containing protein [Pseudomonadota bacterium]